MSLSLSLSLVTLLFPSFLLRFSLLFRIVCFFFSLISKSFLLSFLLFQSCFSAWRLSLIRAANEVSIFIFRYVWPPATIALREREKRGKTITVYATEARPSCHKLKVFFLLFLCHGAPCVLSRKTGVGPLNAQTTNQKWRLGVYTNAVGFFITEGKLIQREVTENGSVCEVGIRCQW